MIELLKDTLREQESMLEEQSEFITSKETELQNCESGKLSDCMYVNSCSCPFICLSASQDTLGDQKSALEELSEVITSYRAVSPVSCLAYEI